MAEESWLQRARARARGCDGCGQQSLRLVPFMSSLKHVLAPETLRLCEPCEGKIVGYLREWKSKWDRRLHDYPLMTESDYKEEYKEERYSYFPADIWAIITAFLLSPISEVDPSIEFANAPVVQYAPWHVLQPRPLLLVKSEYVERLVFCREGPLYDCCLGIEFSNGMRLWNRLPSADKGRCKFEVAIIGPSKEESKESKAVSEFLAVSSYSPALSRIVGCRVEAVEDDHLFLLDNPFMMKLLLPHCWQLTPALPPLGL